MYSHRPTLLLGLWIASAAIRSVFGASPPITAADFAPDGKHVIVGSQAGIELRSWPELAVERTVATELSNIHDVAFSFDAKSLAVAGGTPGDEGVLEIWRWPTLEPISRITPHADVIYKIAWRSDGLQIACASADHEVSLVDVAASRVEHRLAGHSRAVTSIAYLPGDRYLVSGSVDATLRVWDLSNREAVRSLTNHTAEIRDIVVQPQSNTTAPVIASAGADRTIRLWQPLTGRLLRFARLPSEALDLDWTRDATQLVVACADGHVRIIDAESVAIARDVHVLDNWAYTLAVPREGPTVLVGGSGGKLQAARIRTD